MENYKYLLDKLGVDDFILRSVPVGDICLDDLETYYKTLYFSKGEKNGISNVKQNLSQQGFSDEVIDELLSNPEILKTFTGGVELSPEIKSQMENVEKLKKVLNEDRSLPTKKKKELENNLKEAEENLELVKSAFLEQRQAELMSKPETMSILLKMVKNSGKTNIVKNETSASLIKLKNDIYKGFLEDKGFDKDEIISITQNIDKNPKSLTKKEINDLLIAIAKEPENALTGEALDFFTNTPSLRK